METAQFRHPCAFLKNTFIVYGGSESLPESTLTVFLEPLLRPFSPMLTFSRNRGLELQKNFRHTVLFVRCWSTLLSNRPELTAVSDLAMTFRLLNQGAGIALIYFSSTVEKKQNTKKHLLPKFPTLPNLITCDFFSCRFIT